MADKSFNLEHSSLQASMAIGSKAASSSGQFTLSKLKDGMSSGMIMVKKEKVPSPLPPKRVQVDINIKTSSSQKRKTFKATDLSLGNLGAKEALRKLVSFSQPVTNDISWSTVDLKVKAEKAELASKEQVRVCMANNEDLLMRVAPLSK